MSSPSRRHAPSRAAAQRRWEDVTEWPFQFIILPVLVAFAFCLVLFLGSKHGTRLAAFRTWFPSNLSCRSPLCVHTLAVDSEGGLVTGLSAVVAPGAKGGALSGLTGLLRVQTTRVDESGATISAAEDFGVMPLAPEDKLKYDFLYWLAEGEKLAGQQTKDCEVSYGLQYIEKWRKARVDWCTASGGDAAHHAMLVAAAAAATAGTGAPPARGGVGRRLRDISGGGNKTAAAGAASNKQTLKPASTTLAWAASGTSEDASAAGGGGGDAAGATSLSSISLFPYSDKDSNLLFAVSRNSVLDSRSFLGSLPGGMPEALPGSFAAACSTGAGASPGEELMRVEAVRRWTQDALQTDAYDRVSAACKGPVEHPVLLLSRYDSTNAFRTVEEAVSTFSALAVLRDPWVAKEGIQVVLADGKPDGFYLDLWASLSHPYPLRILSQQPWPPNTCLANAVHNMYGGSSILTSMGVARRTTCRSSVVMATSLWLRHLLAAALQQPVRSAFASQQQQHQPNKAVVRKTVVWISRRNYEGLAQANLTAWQDQRRFENEGEVVLELQREVWRWNDEACLRSGLPKSFGSGHHLHHQHLHHLRRLQQLRGLAATFQMDSHHQQVTAGGAAAAAAAGGGGGGGGGGAEPRRMALEALQGRADDLGTDQDPNMHDSAHGSGLLGEEEGVVAAGGVFSAEGAGGGRRGLRGGGSASHCRSSSVFFDLRVVELNDIPFYPDQVQVLGGATVLAGAHGSGLANMIWMAPGKGGVLELHHNSAGNDHYHNQAHLLGHKYVNVDSDGDRVDLAAAAEGLRKLMDALGA